MKKTVVSSTIFTLLSVYFLGCDKSSEQTTQKDIEPVKINQIEENITQKISKVGCSRDKNKSEECSEETQDAAKFILETLSKEREMHNALSTSQSQKEKTPSLREKLQLSLAKIEQEEAQKRDIKEGLIALVASVGESQSIKREELKNFIQNIQNQEDEKSIDKNKLRNFIDTIQSQEDKTHTISLVKKELNSFVEEALTSSIKTKEVKEQLENLIENVSSSESSLSTTEETLKNLVAQAEEINNSSATKFATAIIEDVSTNRISIVEDNQSYLTIRVENGDTLSVLAQRYYNDSGKYKLIYDANKDKIGKNYLIYPSSTLIIPKL